MEQEETKTTAAAGAEMPPEAESWVQLHERHKRYRFDENGGILPPYQKNN